MKKIYYGGDILTLEGENYADAILSEDSLILAVGGFEELSSLAPEAEKIDLGGHCLMPAFIDAHSHLSGYANALLQVPLEEAVSFSDITRRVSDYKKNHNLTPGQWIIARGYDPGVLEEKRHIDKALLNSACPDNPLVIQHKSGHSGVFNSKALEMLGIDETAREKYGNMLNFETGFMEETAFVESVKRVPMPDAAALTNAYKTAQDNYARFGISTVQEGMAVSELLPLFEYLHESGLFTLDLVAYPDMTGFEKYKAAFPDSVGKYSKNLKLGGIKIFLDGSPQSRTAWMRTPYSGSSDCGYGVMSDSDVSAAVKFAADNSLQLLAHCNGDAAAQQFLIAVSKEPRISSLRPVLIHGQLLGRDQLADVKRLGIIPSFFVAHVKHWGDAHIENFGFQRASQISPAKSALGKGIIFTFHQDAPVIEPDMLETIQCAVCRTTKSGVVLGEDEKISPLDAIKAVTINAAYQYFEENEKGSIRAGKHADFVILDRNPLTVPHNEIAEISVLETIKDGKSIFKR